MVPIIHSPIRWDDYSQLMGRLLHGSFSFLCYWTHSFHRYLSDIDVVKVHHAVLRFSSQLPKRINSEPTILVEYDRISSRILDCKLVVNSLLAFRSNGSLGRHLARTSNYWTPQTNNTLTVSNEWLGGFHPDVELLEGVWSGLDAGDSSGGNQLKELLSRSAPIKIEIFGGDMILGDSCSSMML